MKQSEILNRLRDNIHELNFEDESVRAFVRSKTNQKLDQLLEQFGHRLSELTVDSAVNEILTLKNREIAEARNRNSVSISEAYARDELVERIHRLEFQVEYARSFKYLIKTFAERLLEKARLRTPPEKPESLR